MDSTGSEPAERTAVVRLCTEELDRMSRIVENLLLHANAQRAADAGPGVVLAGGLVVVPAGAEADDGHAGLASAPGASGALGAELPVRGVRP